MKTCSLGRPSWPMGRVKVIPLDYDWPAKKQHLQLNFSLSIYVQVDVH